MSGRRNLFIAALIFFVAMLITGLTVDVFPARAEESAQPGTILTISGRVLDAHGNGVKGAVVQLFVEDQQRIDLPETITGRDGSYLLEAPFPLSDLSDAGLGIRAEKTTYKEMAPAAPGKLFYSGLDAAGNTRFLANQDIRLAKVVTPALFIAAFTLILVYGLIITEVVHRALAAFLGAGLILTVSYLAGHFWPGFVVITFEEAAAAIDMNVILLLLSMMLIVGILKVTGVFQWLAYVAFRGTRGNIVFLMPLLMFITAIFSAFLDNVTTMLLIVPVSIQIARVLQINPISLLIPEVFASNVGGTATLIGDPPNIMIGSAAGLSFLDFVVNLAPICFIGLAVTMVYYLWFYRREHKSAELARSATPRQMNREDYRITDKALLVKSLTVLAVVIILFLAHGQLAMEPCVPAMAGAAVLVALSRSNIVRLLEKEIEWATLVFFIMLFIVVGGAKESGLIEILVRVVEDLSQGSLVSAMLIILWASALASAFIDNIPYTATIIPIVASLNHSLPGADSGLLWWALALGACLGGNGTLVGASANLVTAGMAEQAGHGISFGGYFRAAFAPMLLTILLSSAWLLFRV